MSPASPRTDLVERPRAHSSATFRELTTACIDHVQRAASLVQALRPGEGRDLLDESCRDLLSALEHLGSAVRSAAGTGRGIRQIDPDDALMGALRVSGAPWDWTSSRPEKGAASEVHKAARCARAAADLWLTHRREDGVPRSVDAARMSHPAFLGSALNEWREAVRAAAVLYRTCGLGEMLSGDADAVAPGSRNGQSAGKQAAGSGTETLTVARPSRLCDHPTQALVDRCRSLGLRSMLARDISHPPAQVARTVAEAGLAVHCAIALAQQGGGAQLPSLNAPIANTFAQEQVEAWRTLAGELRGLRSAHPPLVGLARDRAEITRLAGVLADASEVDHSTTLWHLEEAARLLAQAAQRNRATIASASRSGGYYYAGRHLPAASLRRRRDLLEARLRDRLVVLPGAVARRIDQAYERVAEAAENLPGGGQLGPAA